MQTTSYTLYAWVSASSEWLSDWTTMNTLIQYLLFQIHESPVSSSYLKNWGLRSFRKSTGLKQQF